MDEIKEVWERHPSTQSLFGSPSQADSGSEDKVMDISLPPAPVDLATFVFYCPGCVK